MKQLLIVTGLIFLTGSVVTAQSSVQPPDGMSEAAAYSIFLENYKNDEYVGAIEYGRWIWKGMPKTIEGYSAFDLEKNLSRLVSVYNGYAKQQDDPSDREAYIDTTLIIFEKAFTDLKDEMDLYEWYFDRGRFYQEHSSFIDGAMDKAVADYQKAFEQKSKEFVEVGDGYYVKIVLQNMVAEGEKDQALAFIEKAEPNASEDLGDYFDEVREKLFDSPEERIAFLENELKENPEDEEIIKKLRDQYEEEEMMKEAQELNEKLYELNPDFENTRALAEFAIRNANYQDAKRYLKEAMDKSDDTQTQATLALKLSDAYMNTDQLQQARRYARRAIDLRSGWGKPYIQIASIYAQAVNECTKGRKMERSDKAVYWLVVDYLEEAKRVDPSVRKRANGQIQTYAPVLPTAEDVHFTSEWTTDESITIDSSLNSCYSWIGESTTVHY